MTIVARAAILGAATRLAADGIRAAEPPSADVLPIMLQDHGDPVQYRSIWVRRFEPVTPRPTADE